MKFLILTIFCITISLKATYSQVASQSNNLEVQVDFESAKAIVSLFDKVKISDSELTRIAKLYGNQQLIKKVGSYSGYANEEFFKKTLREVIETGTVKSDDPFDWKLVKAKQSQVKKLINRLETHETLVSDVRALIQAYTPQDIKATVKACFLVGGGSLGFVIDDPNTFNVGLQKIGDDYEGLVYLVAHELYHSVQGIGRDRRTRVKSLSTPPKTVLYAETLIRNLWDEGSANLVGDFTKIKNPETFTKAQQDGYEKNKNRSAQNFALFESLLFTAYADSTANIEQLYNVGFTVAFDETSYFVGYEIAKVIEEHKGAKALADCINKGPLEFCRLYISLYRGDPKLRMIKFNPSTEVILTKLEVWEKSF